MTHPLDLSRFSARSGPELTEFLRSPGLVHYLGHIARPSVAQCILTIQECERERGGQRDDDLAFHSIHWADEEWVITTLPWERRMVMEAAARAQELAILRGVPPVSSKRGKVVFPYPASLLFTLAGNPYPTPHEGTVH